jgi:hypothetical protein
MGGIGFLVIRLYCRYRTVEIVLDRKAQSAGTQLRGLNP